MSIACSIFLLLISVPSLGLIAQEIEPQALIESAVSSRRTTASPNAAAVAPKTSPKTSSKNTSLLDLSKLGGDDESKPPSPSDDKPVAKGTKETSELSLDDLDSKSDVGDGDGDDQEQKSQEASTSGGWKDNLRFTVDVAVRPTYFGPTGDFGNAAFVGIDLHKVITSEDGDIGTLTLQPFLVRNDNIQNAPQSIFEDPHDWAIEWRIFNFNFTKYGKGKTNFRIGHFELPFGLEQIVNTNGTLRDFTHFQNFGIKNDWGVSFNGENKNVEYEVGLTRGSGNFYRRRDDPFVVSGRIGTSRNEPIVLGLSALHGETLNFDSLGGTTRRSRVGADLTVASEKFVYLSEISAGVENDDPVFTGLFEIDAYNNDETLLFYNQFVVRGIEQSNDWDFEVRDSIGIRWQPNSHWALSTQLTHFFDVLGTASVFSPARRGTSLQVQARYRF